MTLASLLEANLTGTWFTEADLIFANLGETDLTGALGLTQEQLDSAVGDAKTQLPDGYERPTAWPTSTQ